MIGEGNRYYQRGGRGGEKKSRNNTNITNNNNINNNNNYPRPCTHPPPMHTGHCTKQRQPMQSLSTETWEGLQHCTGSSHRTTLGVCHKIPLDKCLDAKDCISYNSCQHDNHNKGCRNLCSRGTNPQFEIRCRPTPHQRKYVPSQL